MNICALTAYLTPFPFFGVVAEVTLGMLNRIPYRASKVNVVVHSKGNVLYYWAMTMAMFTTMENVL